MREINVTISRIPGLTYYSTPPKAEGVAASLSQPPRWIVIHDTGGNPNAGDTASAEAHYAATRTDAQSNWTSAHAYVDTNGALGSLRLDRQAWAAFSEANAHGVHIEMCGGNADISTAVPQATVQHTADLTRQLCGMFGVPVRHCGPSDVAAGRSGICGHYDITVGLGVGDHNDPGPSFDWNAFIALVQQGDTEVGVLNGTVPNGFALDETGALINRDALLVFTSPGFAPFKSVDIATDWSTVNLRVAALTADGWAIKDNVQISSGRWFWDQMPQATVVAVSRHKASVDDSSGNHPVTVAVSY